MLTFTRQLQQRRAIALALLLASGALAAPPAAAPKSLALLRLTFAPGDKSLEDLVKSALIDAGRVRVVRVVAGADLVGKLEIARPSGDTILSLAVFTPGDALLVRAEQKITRGHSLIDGAIALAAQLTAALDGTNPPARSPPPPLVAESTTTRSPAPAAPARVSAPPPSRAKEEDKDDDKDDASVDDPRRRLDFILGAEFGYGPWSADPGRITSGSDNGFDFTNYAPAFTRTLSGRAHPALALHGGWKFLGYGAFEFAYQGSRWSGGASTLWGPRFTGYPLAALWPEHWFDLGIELGGGYSFVNGGAYDMSGTYFTFGLTFEYPITKLFGVVAYYRLFTPFLKNFYVDFSAGLSEPVSGVTTYWNTFGIGLNFHPSIKW